MSTETETARTETETDSFTDIDLGWEHLKNRIFLGVIFAASMFGVVILALLILDIITDFYVGLTEFNIDLVQFLTQTGSRRPEQAGFAGAIVASLMLVVVTGVLSFFVGVGSAIYLEEYAPKTRIPD